jgi:hypothetical protein
MKSLHAREWLIIAVILSVMLSVSLVSYFNKKKIEAALVEEKSQLKQGRFKQ